jgi:hypothetical protein
MGARYWVCTGAVDGSNVAAVSLHESFRRNLGQRDHRAVWHIVKDYARRAGQQLARPTIVAEAARAGRCAQSRSSSYARARSTQQRHTLMPIPSAEWISCGVSRSQRRQRWRILEYSVAA